LTTTFFGGALGLTANKKSKPAAHGKARPGARRGAQDGDPHVSSALRSAYEETVREDVPREFLDLLGRLS
jgi:hypothetical protein